MPFDAKKVKITKLITGEEIISLVEKGGDDYIKITIPFQVFLEPQSQRLHMGPYLHMAHDDEESFLLDVNHFLFSYTPKDAIAEKYKEIYMKMTSGLIIP